MKTRQAAPAFDPMELMQVMQTMQGIDPYQSDIQGPNPFYQPNWGAMFGPMQQRSEQQAQESEAQNAALRESNSNNFFSRHSAPGSPAERFFTWLGMMPPRQQGGGAPPAGDSSRGVGVAQSVPGGGVGGVAQRMDQPMVGMEQFVPAMRRRGQFYGIR